jgi:hypothetical protein
MDPTPKAVDLSVYEEKMKDKKFTVSVKKGESLKEVIKNIQASNSDYIIIDKIENDIKFDRDLNNITTEDLKQFLKVSISHAAGFCNIKLFSNSAAFSIFPTAK